MKNVSFDYEQEYWEKMVKSLGPKWEKHLAIIGLCKTINGETLFEIQKRP